MVELRRDRRNYLAASIVHWAFMSLVMVVVFHEKLPNSEYLVDPMVSIISKFPFLISILCILSVCIFIVNELFILFENVKDVKKNKRVS